MPSRRERPYSRSLFRTALRYFVVGRAAQAAAMFAFTLLSVRLLSPADYGAYMVLLGVVEMCRPLSALGLLPTLQQFLPELAMHATRAQLHRFVKWMTLLRFAMLLLFAAVLFAFWGPVTAWLGANEQQSLNTAIACALIVTVLGAGFTDHMLEALLEQRFAQILRALYPLLRLVAMLAMAAMGKLSLQAMLWIDFGASLICLVLAELVLVVQIRRLEPDGSRHFEWKSIVAFAWHLSGAQLLNSIANPGALRIIVSRMFGVEVAGQFAFMQQLLLQFERFLPSTVLANLVRPMLIARNVQGDIAGVSAAAGLLWKSNVLLVWPGVGLMFVAGDVVVGTLGGSHFPAVGLAMAWLTLSTASSAQGKIVAMVMQVYHYSALVRSLSLLSVLFPLMVLVGAFGGLNGVAIGLALAAWVRSTTALVLLQRQPRGVVLDLVGGVRVLVLVVALTLAAMVARKQIGLPFAVSGYAILLLACLPLVRPLLQQELALLGTVVGKRVERLRCLAR